MKLICISDLHNKLAKINLPPGDALIISGDITNNGTIKELIQFNHVLGLNKDKYKYIILIAGNHDELFQSDPGLAKVLISNVTHYLQDELVEIDGVKFYGSPWQPTFCNWSFNLDRGPAIKAKWDLIPNGIDVLITHGPPYGILDETLPNDEHVGCSDLLDAVMRVKPQVHIFGHIHNSYGIKDFNGTTFINACSCNEMYLANNKPIEIEI